MRTAVVVTALSSLVACADEPSVKIIAPLPDATIVAAVELHLEGHDLRHARTKIYLDAQSYSDLTTNTLPPECGDCAFTISFAGANITNGKHTFDVDFLDSGDMQIATDALSLVFAR